MIFYKYLQNAIKGFLMAKRGRTPSLISGSNGKPSTTFAKQKRACERCGEAILKNQKLFEIPKKNSGFSNKKPYCITCFNEILVQTQNDLNELKSL